MAILLGTFARPLIDPAGRELLVWALAVHLVVQMLAVFITSEARFQRVTIEVTLLADVGVLAVLSAVTGGVASPMTALLVTEVVAVTLLFGRWTGLRASLLCTLAVAWLLVTSPHALDVAADAARETDVATGLALVPSIRAILLLAAIWATALTTGWLTGFIERDLRRRTEDLTLLREVTPHLDPRQGADAVAGSLAELLVVRLGHRASAVWLSSGDRLELRGAAPATDELDDTDRDGLALALDEEVVASALSSGDVHPVRRDDPRPEVLVEHFGERAPLVLVPLGIDGDVVGLVAVEVAARFGRGPTLRVREVRLLRMLAEQASMLLENARLQTELADQAVTDAVTGLPNHRYLQQRLGEELERVARGEDRGEARSLSVALLDLDHFKVVNDTYGHPTGDRVLAAVARAAQQTLRGSDVVCRYGGEEFALILPETGVEAARLACERVREAVSSLRLTAIDGRTLPPVTISIGVATLEGHAVDRATVLARADEALYAAKDGGRDRVVHDADQIVNLT
ncbi:MAG: diguanylate cyclase [Nitriliruptor sp.]|uniref:GGDEF domain-containing protein n=1 Tax=Nitriliruptor sp. TaxID=2448056 RepID=UPI0034A01347